MKMFIFLVLTNFIVFADFAVSQNEISQSDRDAIIYIVQEEKVAHDFYNAMYELHGIISFRSISKSEGLHMDQAKELIENFGIEDPNKEYYETPGSFKNPKFEEMYNSLVRNGTNSIIDALVEAARFEEMDIVDIERFASSTQNEYLKSTFEKLYGVSENHLKALVKDLFERGVEYTPKYLSPEQYNKIITSKEY